MELEFLLLLSFLVGVRMFYKIHNRKRSRILIILQTLLSHAKKGRKCKIARAPKTTHKHQTSFLDCRSNIGWVMSNHDKQAGCRNPCPCAFGLGLWIEYCYVFSKYSCQPTDMAMRGHWISIFLKLTVDTSMVPYYKELERSDYKQNEMAWSY